MRVVADIGNSRIKWGRCGAGKIDDAVSLPVDETAWRDQAGKWGIGVDVEMARRRLAAALLA